MTSADTKTAPLPRIAPSDRLGAVIPVPVSAPSVLEGADLTNVVVLADRRNASGGKAPDVGVKDGERPAPAVTWRESTPWTALVAAVLLLHLGLVLAFMRDPVPLEGLALDSISVEIMLGGETEAGVTQHPGALQSAPSPQVESPRDEPKVTEQTAETSEQVKSELRPRLETAEPQREEPKPEEQKPEEQKTAAAEPEPAPTEPEPTPPVTEQQPAPEKAETKQAKPVEEPVASQPPSKEEPTEKPQEPTKPPPSRIAASKSGVGIGSSRDLRNWSGLVAAHMARNKRYPPDALARGISGTPSVAFTVESDGRVTSVRLARSSGNASIDREIQDLVRRASPFPPPPNGKASLVVPVGYNARAGQ